MGELPRMEGSSGILSEYGGKNDFFRGKMFVVGMKGGRGGGD